MNKKLVRRLGVIALLIAASLTLIQCAPAPSTPQIVKETVVVKQTVPETVVVKQTVPVQQTVTVKETVQVEKQVAVTPTRPAVPKGTVKSVPFLSNETDPNSIALFQKIFAEFAKVNPDISIDLVLGTHGDIGQRVVAARAVGAELGVIQVRPFEMQDFIQAGYLLPLDDIVKEIGVDKFKPGTIIRGADGKVYALAYAGGTHGTLWVRNDQLKEVGLKAPTTYDELMAAAKAMTRDTNGDGKVDIYGMGLPAGPDQATSTRLWPFIYQNCGDYFDKEGNLVFDKPQVLEAIKRYIALLQYSPPGITSWSWFDGLDAYTAGKIAMHPYGGRLGVNVERAAPKIRENSSVIYFPTGEKVKAGRTGYDYWAVFSGVRYPDEAKKFLTFFFTGDRLARIALTVPGHLIPPTEDLAKTILASDNPYVVKYKSDVQTLFDVASIGADPQVNMGAVDTKTCKFEPTMNYMPWASGIFSRQPPLDAEMIQRIYVNKESPESAWKWAYTEMKKISDDWKAKNPQWKPAK